MAIAGIIVMIIGGPLAWLVLAAALLVLADTIMKYAKGKASLWDVLFSALDCIPGGKGLTSMAKLGALWKAGGLRNIGKTGFSAVKGHLGSCAVQLRKGIGLAFTRSSGTEFRAGGGFLDRSLPVTIVEGPGRADGQVVLSGHGYYAGDGWTQIPPGTKVHFYCQDGEKVLNGNARLIEDGKEFAAVEIVGPGELIPDYVLTQGHGLTISNTAQGVDRDTKLSELLEEGMGVVHWAACRERTPFPP